jgi:hypothetical protein
MAHPHAGKVKASNSAKMRAIGPKGGGAGTAYTGMSPFKRVGKDGEQESFNSHSKGFENGYAHGGKVKARGDRRARGGTIKAKGTKGDTPAKGSPGMQDQWGDGNYAVENTRPTYGSNKSKLSGATPGHFARGGKAKKAKGDVNIAIINPHGKPAGMPAPGGGLGATGQPSPTPPPQGGMMPPAAPPGGGMPPGGLAGLAGGAGGGGGGLGALLGGGGMKATGGRIPRQTGGIVRQQQPGMGPDGISPMSHAAVGAPGGMGQAAQHAVPVPVSSPSPSPGPQPYGPAGNSDREFAGPGEGGPISSESAKGGRTSFQFKKGGEVWQANRIGKADGGRLSQGLMPEKGKHWAKYSDDNRKSKHGNTGESEELSLSTETRKADDITKADKRARGGRLRTVSKPKGGKPGAGQNTGEARLQQYRKGIF